MLLKHQTAWGIDHLSRKPVPAFVHPLGKEKLPNVKSEPPLMQVWTLPMHPITGYQGEEIITSLSTSPPQKAAEGNEVTLQNPFLWTRQTQSSQSLLTVHSFQPFH